MGRPQFTTRDLLLCMTLFGVGLGCLGGLYRAIVAREEFPITLLLEGIGGIGGGAFLPFDRETAMTIAGLTAALVVATVLIR